MTDMFKMLTPITYWILIVLWSFILYFYVKKMWDSRTKQLFHALVIILTIDAFRTLFESFYFGLWYTSLSGLIPLQIGDFLTHPELVIIPKILNVIAAVVVIVLLLKRWLPEEEQEKEKMIRVLRDSENRYFSLFANNHSVLLLIDPENGSIVDANPAACDFYGYPLDQFIGKKISEINEHSENEILQEMAKAKSEKRKYFQFQHKLASGEVRDVEVYSGPISLQSKQLLYSTIHDITERKQAEEKLKITTHDLGERLKELNCLYRISELIDKVNITTEEILQGVADLIPPSWQYPEITCAQITIGEQSYRSDDFKETEWLQPQVVTISGMKVGEIQVFYLEEKIQIDEGPFLKEERDLINLIAERIGHVVERKLIEAEKEKLEFRLQQGQKMEAIGTLAGGIAHDFNNILTAILGYAEMARDDCQPGSTIFKDLNEVLGAGNRAKGLVQQILAFSRQGDMERTSIQPASIVQEVIQMLRPSLPTTIEITQDIDAVTGLVFVDPTQLNQILINLCTNAFHAMEDTGGKLDISLKEVTLSNEDLVHEPDVTAGTFIQFSISDSGPGIAPSIKDKIFDPYFTTKEVGKGTGMGLATIHGIVKNNDGFISLYSELGEGTVFHVFLPATAKEALTEYEINDQIPIGSERILFVDDEEILGTMGKTMLERLGYHVTVRNSSLEALKTFQNQPDKFDIVITDQTMPGMTGSDLSRRMLQIRPDIPIILCTGYSTIISEEKAKALGIKEFAFKPLAKKDIAKLIRKVLDVS